MAEPLPPDDEPAPADPPPPSLSVVVVSDLHLEARALEVDAVIDPELTADVLCLLGDIGDPSTPAYAAFIAACAARFPTVLLLAGNNEYRNREPQRHPHKHHHRHSNSNSHPHRRSQDQARPPSTEEGRTAAAASGPGIERAGSTNAGRHSAAEPPAPSAGENVGGSSGAVSSSSGAGGAGGRTMSDTEALIRSVASRHPNVHFLQNGVFESRGVAFIGSTLWSYLPEDPLPPPPGAEQAQQEQAQGPAPEPMPGAASSGPAPAGPAPETAAIGPSVGPTSAPAGPHPAPAASASRATAAQAAALPLSAPESAGRVPPPRVAEAALANHALVVPLRAESLPTWSGPGLPLTAPSGGLGVELEAARAESLPLAAAFACLCANHEHPELHAGSGSGAAGSGSGFGSSVPPGCRALRCRGRFMKRVVSLARLPPDAPCPPVFGGGGRHGSREGNKEVAAVEGAGLLVMGSSVGASSTGTGSGSRSSSGSESGSDSGSSSGSEDEPGSGSGSESEAEEKVEAGKQGQAALAAAQGPGLEDPTAAAPAGGPVDSSPVSAAPTPSPPTAPTYGPAMDLKPSAEPPHTHHRRRPSASQAADPSTETTTITTVRSFIGATSLDYRLIPSAPGGPPITPDTTNALFAAAVEFIAGAVAGARARGLVPVVLTHHAPSLAGTSHPRFAGHPSTHAYGTDLVPYLHGTGIAAWYCGHTHYNFDVRLPCGLRLASNQFGSQPAPAAGYSRSWRQEIAVPEYEPAYASYDSMEFGADVSAIVAQEKLAASYISMQHGGGGLTVKHEEVAVSYDSMEFGADGSCTLQEKPGKVYEYAEVGAEEYGGDDMPYTVSVHVPAPDAALRGPATLTEAAEAEAMGAAGGRAEAALCGMSPTEEALAHLAWCAQPGGDKLPLSAPAGGRALCQTRSVLASV